MVHRELVVIDVQQGEAMESQSGQQLHRPRIYGCLATPAGRRPRTALVLMHPANNFLDHYLLSPLAEAGYAVLGLNSRYMGNDCNLIMERVVLDLGAGVRFLKDRGYEHVVLIGNSGGGSLAAFYQAEAENPTVRTTAAGDPVDLAAADLDPANGVILLAAHPGRHHVAVNWIDPSVVQEGDPLSVDRSLNMFDPANGPPYDAEFVRRYRAAQIPLGRMGRPASPGFRRPCWSSSTPPTKASSRAKSRPITRPFPTAIAR